MKPTPNEKPANNFNYPTTIGTTIGTVPDAVSEIGQYILREQVGEGGMGTVWLADQLEPVRRQVAIKLISRGIADQETIARFEAERQAVSMMDHPNIASIFEAGTASNGLPYFVMEFVNGIPITEYCDRNKLSIHERLSLFVPVCMAVQHAHQKGVVHRDLKPSNVLVTNYDGRPVAKVIDFGLAKATDHTHRLTDNSIVTEIGKILGTLQYMSPEQANLDSVDIDTRTDVYSLGVLLYELLTGSTPLEKTKLRELELLQALNSIREKNPQKPSDRLTEANQDLDEISDNRRISSSKLRQLLRGELDWVVMKALDLDRNRRYASASGFAEDIDRFLSQEPVLARPPSNMYRIKKFAQKNRKALLSITAILLAVTLAIFALKYGVDQTKELNRSRNQSIYNAWGEYGVTRELVDFLFSEVSRQSPSEINNLYSIAAKRITDSDLDDHEKSRLIHDLTSSAERSFYFKDHRPEISALEEKLARNGVEYSHTTELLQGLLRLYCLHSVKRDRITGMDRNAIDDRQRKIIELASRIYEMQLARFGEQDSKTLQAKIVLAICQWEFGFDVWNKRAAAAHKSLTNSIPKLEQQLGESHRAVVESKISLALISFYFRNDGDHAKTIEDFESLRVSERISFDQMHPITMRHLSWFGAPYQMTQQYQKSMERDLNRMRYFLGLADG